MAVLNGKILNLYFVSWEAHLKKVKVLALELGYLVKEESFIVRIRPLTQIRERLAVFVDG
jgi:hypothetical protein